MAAEASGQFDIYKKARKYNFVSNAVTNEAQFKNINAEIDKLKKQKAELESQSNCTLGPKELEQANMIEELKRQRYEIRSRIRDSNIYLQRVNMNLNLGVMPTEADLSSLSDFFPEANIEKLVKIEQFHNKIQKILKDELEESKIKIEGQLNILNERFETIESKLADLKPSMAYSSEFLNTLVDLATKIKDLEKENQAFQERKRLQKDAIDAKKQYQERTKYTIHSIEGKI